MIPMNPQVLETDDYNQNLANTLYLHVLFHFLTINVLIEQLTVEPWKFLCD